MAPDELRARCDEAVEAVYCCKQKPEAVQLIEALCREMMAVGVQSVATHLRIQHLQEFGHARLLGVEGELYDWCQVEAQRVKENHDTEKA